MVDSLTPFGENPRVSVSRTAGHGTDATEVPDGVARQWRGAEPGERIGRYVVEGPIGAGGMGAVVAARDPELGRSVAIKVLHRVDDKAEIWLRREAQALARLNHPNVIVVHDVGMVEGRPFIAMERIDGVTMRAWLGARKRSTREILTVFSAAARGLAAAHEVGMVHCDFKPTNVMICNGAGESVPLADAVRIMDFGLARESAATEADPLDDTPVFDSESLLSQDFTGFDKLRGTPKYMAPEQFALEEVGPAVDQYAFCISLYEALWGRSPFEGETAAARAAAKMRGAKPSPPPSTSGQRGLVRAVLRGLEPRPEDRWPSMDALRVALQPRHRALRWGAAVAGVLGVTGLAGLVAGQEERCAHADARADEVWNASERAAIEAAFAETGHEFAEGVWSRSEAVLDVWVRRWRAGAIDNCRAMRTEAQSERDFDGRAFCLSRQLESLSAVTEALRTVDAPGVSRALDTVEVLPDPDACVAGTEAVFHPADPARAAEVEAAFAELDRCAVLGAAGDAKVFLRCAEGALASAREVGDANAVLEARRTYANALSAVGQDDDARAEFEEVYFDANAAGRSKFAARTALKLAHLHVRRRGGVEDAWPWLRHAEGMRETDADKARYARTEAFAAHMAGDRERAIERAKAAVEFAERSEEARILGTTLNMLGKVLNESERPKEAQAVYERALEVQIEARGEAHPSVATSLNNLATILAASGDLEGSLRMFERALKIRRTFLPAKHRHIATATANVAETLVRLGRYEDALTYHRESADVFAAVEGEDSWYHATLRADVALDLRKLGRLEEARVAIDIALQAVRRHPLEHRYRFIVETEAALLAEAEGQPEAALEFFESALRAKLRQSDRKTAEAHLQRLRTAGKH